MKKEKKLKSRGKEMQEYRLISLYHVEMHKPGYVPKMLTINIMHRDPIQKYMSPSMTSYI